ncbi:hypothetical protein [Thermus sediminis]|uniref:hypothetical protein n=1 Tax=Thermus sediminis TaxID=1761908 RepID=UPI000E3DE98E|nr:hypothetical protein [Thermus sediminis]
MRRIRPIARRFPLEEAPNDLAEWRTLSVEERLKAVFEMALFWARWEMEEARKRGETPEIALDRLLPVARRRPLK